MILDTQATQWSQEITNSYGLGSFELNRFLFHASHSGEPSELWWYTCRIVGLEGQKNLSKYLSALQGLEFRKTLRFAKFESSFISMLGDAFTSGPNVWSHLRGIILRSLVLWRAGFQQGLDHWMGMDDWRIQIGKIEPWDVQMLFMLLVLTTCFVDDISMGHVSLKSNLTRTIWASFPNQSESRRGYPCRSDLPQHLHLSQVWLCLPIPFLEGTCCLRSSTRRLRGRDQVTWGETSGALKITMPFWIPILQDVYMFEM